MEDSTNIDTKIRTPEQAKQVIDTLYHGKEGYFFSDTFIGYCRDHAVKQFKQWLENHNIDSTKVRIVHTHHLGKFEDRPYHAYNFIWRFDTNENLNRPNCPECGSYEIVSKGMSWYCKKCGRWFIKKRRSKTQDNKHQKNTI